MRLRQRRNNCQLDVAVVSTSRHGRNIWDPDAARESEAVMKDGLCEAFVCIGLIDLDAVVRLARLSFIRDRAEI